MTKKWSIRGAWLGLVSGRQLNWELQIENWMNQRPPIAEMIIAPKRINVLI